MTYMNPYFANLSSNPNITEHLFKEGIENGYFIMNQQDEPYLINSGNLRFGQLDFTNDKAREWAKNIIKKNMIEEAGAIGWMADFAEYTPMDSKFSKWDGPS